MYIERWQALLVHTAERLDTAKHHLIPAAGRMNCEAPLAWHPSLYIVFIDWEFTFWFNANFKIFKKLTCCLYVNCTTKGGKRFRTQGIASRSEAFPSGGSLKWSKPNCLRQYNQKTDRLQASLRRFCLFWLIPLRGGFLPFGGERGIRTPDTLLGYTRFPGGPVQPLLHLSFTQVFWVSGLGMQK